jgi:predicted neuraminidase
MRAWTVAAVFWLAVLPCGAAEPFFQSVDIFPPEDKHNHASCVVELANGDLLAAWYSGSGERSADDVVIQGAWLKKGNVLWGPRFLMADTPGYPDCNPALFAGPDGSVWLFWPTIIDHRWESAVLKFASFKDSGVHSGPPAWSREGVIHITPKRFAEEAAKAVAAVPDSDERLKARAVRVASERANDLLYQRLGWMPRVHPTVLPSGRWLLPLYTDTFSASIVAYSDDHGANWSTSAPMIGFGNIQPSLVRKNDGTVVAFMRDNGPHRRIRLSESRDEGKTWGPVTDSAFPNPGAGIEAIRLTNGHWALVYNDTTQGRHSLALSISDDEGKSWKWTRHVERQAPGQGSYHYPSLLQARDGRIHVTYTHRGQRTGSTIEHAVFNEEWVVAGGGPGAH